MSTYLQLVNKVLVRLNEVELTESNFAGVKGIYAQAKQAVNDALREIDTTEDHWPFNAYEHTEALVAGTYEYAWPIVFKTADWNSFQLQKDATLGINSKSLKILDKEEWYKRYRDLDDDAGSDGRGIPEFIFQTHGNGYGITPSPNEAYELKYRYYAQFTVLSAYSDACLIPEAFDHVIINGALKYMYIYLDNPQMADLMDEKHFKPSLKYMRKLLINDEQYFRDTRVKF